MKKVLVSFALLLASQITSAQGVSSKCYRGFADAGYTIGIGDYEFDRIEVNTSHGYQINPYFFVGGGVGLHFMQKYETPNQLIALDQRDSKVDIPVFANVRADFCKGRITPFIDVKAGTYVTHNGGLYLNLSAGCRYVLEDKQAVNISIGYTSEELEFDTFEGFPGLSTMKYTRSSRKLTTEGIAIKMGYDF